MCITPHYREKINKTSRRKLYDPRDQCVFEFHTIQEKISKDHIIPMLFDSKLKYLTEGSKDGELGNFLFGNNHFIDMSDVYVSHEEKHTTLMDEVENNNHEMGESLPSSPTSVFSPVAKSPSHTAHNSPTFKFRERVRGLYEVIRTVVFPTS